MTHLNDTEFVDLIEGAHALSPERARHLDGCGDCRAKADALRDALKRTTESDVPEPSPLFWDHFSSRVHDAVNESATPRHPWFGGWSLPTGRESALRWVQAAAVVAVLAVVGVWALVARMSGPAPEVEEVEIVSTANAPGNPEAVTDAGEVADDVEADEAWALVRTIADDVSWDETLAAGVSTRPGSADRAALQLTVGERSELMRLLKADMKRPGA